MQICITGATGFLGSSLVRYWAKEGHQLLLLIRPESNLKRIADVLEKFHSSVRVAIITDEESIGIAFKDFNPDVLAHTACSYGRDPEAIVDLLKANILYGLQLMRWLNRGGDLKSVTFINFDSALNNNVNHYAKSKDQFVEWGKEFVKFSKNKIQLINIRLQLMYGPGDDDAKFIVKAIKTCLNCEAILPITDGEQRRDLIYIEDVVEACDKILLARTVIPKIHDIDLGTGRTVSIRDYVSLVHEMTQSSTHIRFGMVQYRENEQFLCVAETSGMERLGWAPRFTLRDGLQNTINEIKKEMLL